VPKIGSNGLFERLLSVFLPKKSKSGQKTQFYIITQFFSFLSPEMATPPCLFTNNFPKIPTLLPNPKKLPPLPSPYCELCLPPLDLAHSLDDVIWWIEDFTLWTTNSINQRHSRFFCLFQTLFINFDPSSFSSSFSHYACRPLTDKMQNASSPHKKSKGCTKCSKTARTYFSSICSYFIHGPLKLRTVHFGDITIIYESKVSEQNIFPWLKGTIESRPHKKFQLNCSFK
jgi:hypothetical protein